MSKEIKYFGVLLYFFWMNCAYSAVNVKGGLTKTSDFISKLNTALHSIAIIAVLTAIIVTWFKIMFNGESIRDCKNWIIGAVLIVGASEIWAMLLK